ncbi:MAG: conjugal transfer protein TraN [Rickettsiales bacterium]|jgi:hypothetical protein|nr:conjugal transfer protein TraN [Rickettsiales bacterium]
MIRILLLLLIFNFFKVYASDFKIDSSVFDKANKEGIQSIVPGYVENVNISKENLEEQGQKAQEKNEASQFLVDSYDSRPQIDATGLNNIISNTADIMKNKEQVINKNYGDCENAIDYKICYNYTGSNFCDEKNINSFTKVCNVKPIIKCSAKFTDIDELLKISINVSKGTYSYESGVFKVYSLDYSSVDFTINMEIGNIEGLSLVLKGSNYTHIPTVLVNEQNIALSSNEITKYFKNGKNVMRVYFNGSCGVASHHINFEFVFKIVGSPCKELYKINQEICVPESAKDSQCFLKSSKCVEGSGTKTFEGLQFYSDCWNTEKIYNCDKLSTDCFNSKNDCSNFEIENCILEQKDNLGNNTERLTYKCVKESSNNVAGDCNAQINTTPEAIPIPQDNTGALLKSLSYLMGINEVAKGIDVNNLTILNGESLNCKKSTGIAGALTDCCNDDKLEQDLHIRDCSQSEEKLKLKRQQKTCLYLGNYCSNDSILGCLMKRYVYCCYQNKFSRIIANASVEQNLNALGNAKNPDCSGILLNKLGNINFDLIDFSEMYGEIEGNISKDKIDKQIKDSINKIIK